MGGVGRGRGREDGRRLDGQREHVARLAVEASPNTQERVPQARPISRRRRVERRAALDQRHGETREDHQPVEEAEVQGQPRGERVLDQGLSLRARISQSAFHHQRIQRVVEVQASPELEMAAVIGSAQREAVLTRGRRYVPVELDRI